MYLNSLMFQKAERRPMALLQYGGASKKKFTFPL
jgi:hypothetical protein